jgi:hypothetical protein
MNKSVCAAICLTAFFSAAYAETCTPPADEYIGMRDADGKCYPLHKNKLFNFNDCTPDLTNRGVLEKEITFAGEVDRYKCVIPARPIPPSNGLQDQIDELRKELDELKREQRPRSGPP